MNLVDATLLEGKRNPASWTRTWRRARKSARDEQNPQQLCAALNTEAFCSDVRTVFCDQGQTDVRCVTDPNRVTPKRKSTQTEDHGGGMSRGNGDGRKPAMERAGRGAKPFASRLARAVPSVGTDPGTDPAAQLCL